MSRVYAIESALHDFGQRRGLPAGRCGRRGWRRFCPRWRRGWSGRGGLERLWRPRKRRSSSTLLADIAANPGKSVVVVGPQHEPDLHALALAINDKIGAIGSTVTLSKSRTDRPHSSIRSPI